MKQEFSLMKFGGYKSEFDKWGKIKSQLEKAESMLQTMLCEGKADEIQTHRDRQIKAVLEGREPDTIVANEKWREDVIGATQRRNLFIYASREQESKVASERIKASVEICKSLLPKYKDIIQKSAKVLIALGEVINEERELREALNDNNIAYASYIIPSPISAIGNPLDTNSRFAFWLIESVKNGYIDFKIIPKIFREKWFQSSGFKFPGDDLKSEVYSEAKYFKKLKSGSVDVVLNKIRKNVEIESKNI